MVPFDPEMVPNYCGASFLVTKIVIQGMCGGKGKGGMVAGILRYGWWYLRKRSVVPSWILHLKFKYTRLGVEHS